MISFVNNNKIDKSILEQVLINKEFIDKCILFSKVLFENELNRIIFTTKRIFETKNKLIDLEELFAINQSINLEYMKYNKLIDDYLQYNKTDDEDNKTIDEKMVDILNTYSEIFQEVTESEMMNNNPIIDERNTIIDEGVGKIKDIITNSIKEHDNYSFHVSQGFDDIRTRVFDGYEKVYINNIATITQIYIKTIKKMNTLEQRLEMTHYMEELVKRRRETNKMLSVDLKSIKSYSRTKDEFRFIEDIYYRIDQLNKQITKKEELVFNTMNSLNVEDALELDLFDKMFNKTAFKENVIHNKELVSIWDEYQLNKYKTMFNLYQKISDELNNAMRFSMKEIYNDSAVFRVLSCDVVQQLKDLSNDLEKIDLEQIKDERHRKIIVGIIESISLKYESIKEQNEVYYLTKKEDVVAYEKRLMDYIEEIEEKLEDYFLESVNNSSESFAKAENKYNRIYSNIKELNERYDLAHLKNNILSEVVTLDEIIDHSVNRLLESDQVAVDKVSNKIIACSKNIYRSIKSSNIDVIYPDIKTKFDGNLHEIVSVKELDGYVKGEIYQVFSSGFRYNKRVLIRSNVAVIK